MENPTPVLRSCTSATFLRDGFCESCFHEKAKDIIISLKTNQDNTKCFPSHKLNGHKELNLSTMRDDISFVSLGDTFKPDDAVSLSTTETERNWNTVFAEAVTAPRESDLPVAHAVTIDEETHPSMIPTNVMAISGPSNGTTIHQCNFFTIVIGYSHLIVAVTVAFAIELASVSVYLLGVAFYWISQNLKSICGTWILPLGALFMMLTAMMLSVDLLILTLGIMVVEMVAWITCGLFILFGGVSAGIYWHQHIRKVCHLSRWAFRGFHSSWTPKRILPFGLPEGTIQKEDATEEGIPVESQPSKTNCELSVEDETVGEDEEGNYT